MITRLLDILPRPLDPVRSIKLKIGLLMVASGAAGLTYFYFGLGWFPFRTSAIAIAIALLTSQLLAHGMTSPLREMTAAARAMARGDYTRRVRASSRDEVGELAVAFNQMAANLDAANRQGRELIANVSHELRTPITALRGLLENIVDGVSEPDPAMMRTALTQTERLSRLVAELLDLSRLDAGVATLRRTPVDVAQFLTEVVAEAEVTAVGAGRDVRFAIQPPARRAIVPADRARLQQVFANLLDNAARHSPPAGTVTLSARTLSSEVVFEITDEGSGIPAEQRLAVFERFTRGAKQVPGRDGGSGLGLAIARWVVQLHGGSIAALDPPAPPAGALPGCLIQVTIPRRAIRPAPTSPVPSPRQGDSPMSTERRSEVRRAVIARKVERAAARSAVTGQQPPTESGTPAAPPPAGPPAPGPPAATVTTPVSGQPAGGSPPQQAGPAPSGSPAGVMPAGQPGTPPRMVPRQAAPQQPGNPWQRPGTQHSGGAQQGGPGRQAVAAGPGAQHPPAGARLHTPPPPWAPQTQSWAHTGPPPPRPPSAFTRRWPGPGRAAAAGIAVLLGAAATGAAAAIAVPVARTGLGWSIVAIVAAVAVGWASRKHIPAWDQIAWAVATVALLSVGTFRSAGWLFGLCLLTAVATAALAVVGGRSLAAMLLSLFTVPVATFRSLPWVVRGLAGLRRKPDGEKRSTGVAGLRLLAAVALSLLLLLIFGALFASADLAFAKLASSVIPTIDAGTVSRWLLLFPLFTLGTLGAAYVRSAPPDLSGLESRTTTRVRRLEWALPLTALVLLFTAFVLVQLTVFFGGPEYVLGPDGPTFANYARGGFWQLLLVTLLTLAVLGGAARWAPREEPGDRVLIRVLLGALSVLTLVIVASALYRMHVYEQAYGFTRLRVLVSLCELWLGAVFVMVLAAGVRLRGGWLPGAILGTGVFALLALAVANPDRFIADHNIDRFAATAKIDVRYLSTLSADAVPELDRLTGEQRDCALSEIARDLRDHPDKWYEWNLGRHQARALIKKQPPADKYCYSRGW